MGWETEITRIVRFLINDIDSTTYCDDRLEETILVAAQLLLDSMDFDNTYIVEVDAGSLSPDPTTLSDKDNWFINILAVKTACIVLGSEAKTLAAQNYTIKDGPSSISIAGAYQSVKQLADEMNHKLDKMIVDYRLGGSIAGTSILGPYVQESLADGTPLRNYE